MFSIQISNNYYYRYCKDVVILCSFVVAVAAFWSKILWLLLLIPAYLLYKSWRVIIAPWFFAEPLEQEEEKKMKKRERRLRKAWNCIFLEYYNDILTIFDDIWWYVNFLKKKFFLYYFIKVRVHDSIDMEKNMPWIGFINKSQCTWFTVDLYFEFYRAYI